MSDTELIEAVRTGNPDLVRALIQSGSDVNQQDEQGWTPLNWASGRGHPEIVKLLVESGADVFKVGRDLRTPYLIALAAGRVEVVKYLSEVEDRIDGEKPARPERKYCKAYHLRDLRAYPEWFESRVNWREKKDNNGARDAERETQEFADDSIVFVHQDYSVTESMWHNENVIFNRVTPAWVAFCAEELGFKVPDDLDLIVPAKSSEEVVSAAY